MTALINEQDYQSVTHSVSVIGTQNRGVDSASSFFGTFEKRLGSCYLCTALI